MLQSYPIIFKTSVWNKLEITLVKTVFCFCSVFLNVLVWELLRAKSVAQKVVFNQTQTPPELFLTSELQNKGRV